MLSDVGRGTPWTHSEGLSRMPIPQLELIISSGYLRGPSKVSQAICVLSICCGPTFLPCLLPPARLGGLLPACPVVKCISASAAETRTAREHQAFGKGSSCSSWGWCNDRTGVCDSSRQDIKLPVSFIFWSWIHIWLSPAKEERGDPALHPLSSPSSCPIPLGMVLVIR